MRNRVAHDLADVPGHRPHDHDAVGQEDRFFDQVRDHHDAFEARRRQARRSFEGPAAGHPQVVDFVAEGLRGEDVEGVERLVHGEQLGTRA